MALQTFATIEQYDARFPGRTAADGTLTACLEDATAAIMTELDQRGIPYESPDEAFADRLMRTCRSVANRILPQAASDVPQGVIQASISAVGFTQSYSYGTAYGTPKLLDSELSMLGIGGGTYVYAEPYGGRDAGA